MRRGVFRRFGLDPGLCQKTKISEPIDESILPGAERRTIAMLQAVCVHAVSIHVHFDVRNPRSQHR